MSKVIETAIYHLVKNNVPIWKIILRIVMQKPMTFGNSVGALLFAL